MRPGSRERADYDDAEFMAWREKKDRTAASSFSCFNRVGFICCTYDAWLSCAGSTRPDRYPCLDRLRGRGSLGV